MQITRKDIGYTIYSRLEEALRHLIRDKLLTIFSADWQSYIPEGVWGKIQEKLSFGDRASMNDPDVLLEESDIPDLMEIICYKNSFEKYITPGIIPIIEFRSSMGKLYNIRCKIAHVKSSFSALDLDALLDIARRFIPILNRFNEPIKQVLQCIINNPEKVAIKIPAGFFIYDDRPSFAHLTNLPPGDYDPDGGFIGRRDDVRNILRLIDGNLHRVITIAGAGGVGKSAIAHHICEVLLNRDRFNFDAIIWVSAKEEKLTITGIEQIEPTLRNYESVLDRVLETFGWVDDLKKPIKDKEESVNAILQAGDEGILLVIDNLETIKDERVLEFIKDFPPPSKVLITSRLGLGEVERRYPLAEMSPQDAIALLRVVAREKSVVGLTKLSDKILEKYVNKMSRYPLAIKWVVGQIARGKDIASAIKELTSPTGDVARFCFEHIFDNLLSEEERMALYVLSVGDRPLTRGVLLHLSSGMTSDQLDVALRQLTIASLVIPTQIKTEDDAIETKYELLPLTRNYIQSKLQAQAAIQKDINKKIETAQNLIEEADRAGKQYRYSLKGMGAESEEEKIAATLAITGYQKFQSNKYDDSVKDFEKAAEIAPNYPAIYRNWATMESEAGFFDKANMLMEKAVKLDPNDSKLWFIWGNVEKRRQRYDYALKYLKKALALSPDDAPILGAIGDVERRKGNYKEADILLRKALSGTYSESTRRHEIIGYTALADNMRRWAESLFREKKNNEAMEKIKEAFSFATKAIDLGGDDIRAQNTLLEVSSDLAIALLKSEGLEKAGQYFKIAITEAPDRDKERKINERCCLYYADALLENGKQQEARKYIEIGKKHMFPDSRYLERYNEIEKEFAQKREVGIILKVDRDHGYGFIKPENISGQNIFLHISAISPKISSEEFENIIGRKVSFLTKITEKGLSAIRAKIIK